MGGGGLLAGAALLLWLAVAMSLARAAGGAFEPEAVVRRVDRLSMTALALAGERIVAAGERGRILVSADGGGTWTVAATPTHHTLTSLHFADARNGLATGHQGVLLRSRDGGVTW